MLVPCCDDAEVVKIMESQEKQLQHIIFFDVSRISNHIHVMCFIVLRLSSSSRSHHLLGTQALGATFAVELPSWWLRGGILMKGNWEIGKLVFVQMIAEAFLFYIF